MVARDSHRRGEVEEMNRAKFFQGIRKVFGKLDQKQVDGITAILDEWDRRGLKDMRCLAYMFATAKIETAHTMQPITEMGGLKYLKSKRYWPWVGRGWVQLTWEYNYRKAKQKTGADLLSNPELALNLAIATKIMFDGMAEGWFTGKKLGDYFNNQKTDWVNARKIINGRDRDREIGGLAATICNCLIEAKEQSNG